MQAAIAHPTRFDVVQQPALVAMRRAVQAAYAELRATDGDGLVRGFESYETVAARGVAVAALRATWRRLVDDYEAAVVVALAGLSAERVAS